LQIKGSDDRIAADSRDRRHVKDAPDFGASAPDATAAAQSAAVTIKGRQAGQCRDLLAIQRSQFRQLRVISSRVCCQWTPETTVLIGREALAAMKQDAALVNVARGEIIDENALVAALDGGKLRGVR